MSSVPIYIFRVSLDNDNFTIYRDIAVLPNQSLSIFLQGILASYNFDDCFEAEFYKCDGAGKLLNAFDLKKPILLNDCIDCPHQEFRLLYKGIKSFLFKIILLKISSGSLNNYPVCIQKEGTGPAQYDPEKTEDLSHLTPKQLLEIKASFR